MRGSLRAGAASHFASAGHPENSRAQTLLAPLRLADTALFTSSRFAETLLGTFCQQRLLASRLSRILGFLMAFSTFSLLLCHGGLWSVISDVPIVAVLAFLTKPCAFFSQTQCHRTLGRTQHTHGYVPFLFIGWRLTALQYCSGFCHTLTWISHGFTCVPHLEPLSRLPPHPIPWVFPVHQARALVSCQPGLEICFTLDSVLVSMLFSLNIPPSPSLTESKSLFYTSVSLFLFCI